MGFFLLDVDGAFATAGSAPAAVSGLAIVAGEAGNGTFIRNLFGVLLGMIFKNLKMSSRCLKP